MNCFFCYLISVLGAPHIHTLLWLADATGKEAPSFWSTSDMDKSKIPEDLNDLLKNNLSKHEATKSEEDMEKRKVEISNFVRSIIFGSIDDAKCKIHRQAGNENDEFCTNCNLIKERVEMFNTHSCTFSCKKKKRTVHIRETEGHGRLDGKLLGESIICILCRYNFPHNPIDETTFLLGIPKDLPEEEIEKRKMDYRKIRKYLIRQTCSENNDSESWEKLRKMSFNEFLVEVGMLLEYKVFDKCSSQELKQAKKRYLEALSVSVRGTGSVLIRREPKDIFTNNFNPSLMEIHGANHDVQPVVDQYACAQYICGYLTKNEDGASKTMKAVNDEAGDLSKMEVLNRLAAVLDKHREVSIQEAVYRMMGFPMTKSSVVVKYLSTSHPNHRDGLLKGDLKNLPEGESIFHNSPQTYYENRPNNMNESVLDEDKKCGIDDLEETDSEFEDLMENEYDEKSLKDEDWDALALSEFWSKFDVVYEGKKNDFKSKNLIALQNGKGWIKKRKTDAVLRYYLNYENNDDFCRGLLILFLPFRDEMSEIHEKDVKTLVLDNWAEIQKRREEFEAFKVMMDLINDIQKLQEQEEVNLEDDSENEPEEQPIETTSETDLKDFDKWARDQAKKSLKGMAQFISLESPLAFRKKIC